VGHLLLLSIEAARGKIDLRTDSDAIFSLHKLREVKKRGTDMLTEYIEEALKRAHYEIINDTDEPYYGEVPELPGVWANAKTLETCRENLKEVVEGWILLSIKKALPLPKLGDVEIKEIQEEAARKQS
jgi:predicted RNase H-like HicB family nuclease